MPTVKIMNTNERGWFFFFKDTATTEIYTLSLPDALPIYLPHAGRRKRAQPEKHQRAPAARAARSEEHTSELQSRRDLVCRLLPEKTVLAAAQVLFEGQWEASDPWMTLVGYFNSLRDFFFNDTATTEIYTLSLHDALPI